MNDDYSSTSQMFEFKFHVITLISAASPILNVPDIQIKNIILWKKSNNLERDDEYG